MATRLLFDLFPYIHDEPIYIEVSKYALNSPNYTALACSGMLPLQPNYELGKRLTDPNSFIVWTNLRSFRLTEVTADSLKNCLPLASVERLNLIAGNYEKNAARKPILENADFTLLNENGIRWGHLCLSEESKYIHRISALWQAYFECSHITSIVCQMPHSYEDLIGIFTAIRLGIGCHMFVLNCFGTQSLINASNSSCVRIPLETQDFTRGGGSPRRGIIREYIEKQYSKNFSYRRPYLGQASRDNKAYGDHAQRRFLQSSLNKDISLLYYYSTLLASYQKISALFANGISMPSGARPVLIALHSQPEATTVPQALEWFDQIEVIKHVRAIYPLEHPLLVKEHPGQFQVINELVPDELIARRIMELTRPPDFYKEISNFPNTYLVPINISNSSLFDRYSPVVVANTGTISMEAYIHGLSVHQLDRNWSPYYEFLIENGPTADSKAKREDIVLNYFCERVIHSDVDREFRETVGADSIQQKSTQGMHFFNYNHYQTVPESVRLLWASRIGTAIKAIS